MNNRWNPDDVPDEPRLGPTTLALFLIRGTFIAVTIYGLMIVLFLARLLEAPFGRLPISPRIVQLACKISLGVIGLEVKVEGVPMAHSGAVVSNHSSWLDIFVLNASHSINFVSKAEVGKWPIIGQIARAAGTVFIERRSSQAGLQKSQFEERLLKGDRLLFFPEGTSTDTRRILPFKSSLFAAFFDRNLVKSMWIQPTTMVYLAPKGQDNRFYGWWGEMEFMPHFIKTLGASKTGQVIVKYHPPVAVKDFENRKELAQYCEEQVRSGLVFEQ